MWSARLDIRFEPRWHIISNNGGWPRFRAFRDLGILHKVEISDRFS
jgi:hypothetical protein